MNRDMRQAIAGVIYALVGVAVGGLIAGTQSGAVQAVGKTAMLLAGLYGLVALIEIARQIVKGDQSPGAD